MLANSVELLLGQRRAKFEANAKIFRKILYAFSMLVTYKIEVIFMEKIPYTKENLTAISLYCSGASPRPKSILHSSPPAIKISAISVAILPVEPKPQTELICNTFN